MDEAALNSLACSLMYQLMDAFEGAFPDKAQIVVRYIRGCPDGEQSLWVVVNWPN